ncbi:hypothetical protein ACFLIM_20910 [Nonomuraea sp. M3C6]|uniref:BON domain-containing protein n=1 Tax=Nonomuraea marmarensis TaxID=3351344 RepID=A0ABW7AE83_9ACTN
MLAGQQTELAEEAEEIAGAALVDQKVRLDSRRVPVDVHSRRQEQEEVVGVVAGRE